jgi:hypothetical protein
MGVPGRAAAGRFDVQGRMEIPASQRGVIALNGAGDTSIGAVPVVSTERSAMKPTVTRPSATSPSDPCELNLIRTGAVVRHLLSFRQPARKAGRSQHGRAAR